MAVVAIGILRGDRCAVGEQDAGHVDARRMGEDRAAKAALDQQRQAPAVVDVRMAEHDGVDGCRVKIERRQIASLISGASLDHAAVQQHAMAGDVK